MDRFLRWLAPRYRRFVQRRRVDDLEGALAAARATVRRKKYCLLATRSEAGVDARVLQPVATSEEDLTIWLGAAAGSRKVAQLRAWDRAALVYQDDAREACVVLIGRAAIVEDLEERRRRFPAMFLAFFPDGPDHGYALVRFETERIELIDFGRRVVPEPFGLAPYVIVRRGGAWARA